MGERRNTLSIRAAPRCLVIKTTIGCELREVPEPANGTEETVRMCLRSSPRSYMCGKAAFAATVRVTLVVRGQRLFRPSLDPHRRQGDMHPFVRVATSKLQFAVVAPSWLYNTGRAMI